MHREKGNQDDGDDRFTDGSDKDDENSDIINQMINFINNDDKIINLNSVKGKKGIKCRKVNEKSL